MFVALSLDAKGRYREGHWARQLWRALLATEVVLCACFALAAGIVRYAFDANPTAILNAVPYVWSVAGWLVAWFIWHHRERIQPRRNPGSGTGRWLVLCAAIALAVRPWIPDSNIVFAAPYEIVEWFIDSSTNGIASNECLAARITEYDMNSGVFSGVGGPA